MTKEEFNEVFRILVGECFVPRDSIEIWATALMDLDIDDVKRNIEQYRVAKQYRINLVALPEEVRRDCQLFHGYDSYTWDQMREIRDGGGIYV